MKRKELKVEELEVGQFVTVFKGATYSNGTEDNSFKGDVLEVKAIDIPFAVFKRHHQMTNTFTLDTRQGWTFTALTKEYVDAMMRNQSQA